MIQGWHETDDNLNAYALVLVPGNPSYSWMTDTWYLRRIKDGSEGYPKSCKGQSVDILLRLGLLDDTVTDEGRRMAFPNADALEAYRRR